MVPAIAEHAFGCPGLNVPTLVAYISGHGFGHASRTIELLNAIADRAPDMRIRVRTAVAPWLFEATARPGIVVTPVECDTGAVQIDSLRLDEMETIRRAERFMATFTDRIAVEAAAIAREDASLVIADAPPLGIAAGQGGRTAHGAARQLHVGLDLRRVSGRRGRRRHHRPRLRLGRPGGAPAAARRIRAPAGASTMCRSSRDVHGATAAQVRQALGLPADRPLALVSFGGYGVDQLDLAALARTPVTAS